MVSGILLVAKIWSTFDNKNLLEQIKANNEIIFVTRNNPTTYYEKADGAGGLEFELAKMFADELGVKLTLVIPESLNDLLLQVKNGNAHIAAAGLTITKQREKQFRFGPAYQEITEQLIYNASQPHPKSLSTLDDAQIEVVANSSHAERLRYLEKLIPSLNWKENFESDSAELLQLVSEGIIDYTVADSNEVALTQRSLLNLRIAFDISEPESLAWALQKSDDNSLLLEVQKFFKKIKKNGELNRIIERNYGHVEAFDYVDTKIFKRHIITRLPKYLSMFKSAAKKYNMDWRLLAAMGYQESHWNPKAISPTGVRGIMMLTQRTAKELGVKNRLDPASSIEGGAKYYNQIFKRIDPKIPDPDRSWMTMAAYNVGYAHLQGARKITRLRGKNDNLWYEVKKSLPLLAQKKWYKKTRYGYARGWEPVQYVENIRSYYDIIKLNDEEENETRTTPLPFIKIPNSI